MTLLNFKSPLNAGQTQARRNMAADAIKNRDAVKVYERILKDQFNLTTTRMSNPSNFLTQNYGYLSLRESSDHPEKLIKQAMSYCVGNIREYRAETKSFKDRLSGVHNTISEKLRAALTDVRKLRASSVKSCSLGFTRPIEPVSEIFVQKSPPSGKYWSVTGKISKLRMMNVVADRGGDSICKAVRNLYSNVHAVEASDVYSMDVDSLGSIVIAFVGMYVVGEGQSTTRNILEYRWLAFKPTNNGLSPVGISDSPQKAVDNAVRSAASIVRHRMKNGASPYPRKSVKVGSI